MFKFESSFFRTSGKRHLTLLLFPDTNFYVLDVAGKSVFVQSFVL